MKNLFRLASVMIRGNGLLSLSGDTGRRRKKRSLIGSLILFTLLAVYLTFIMTFTSIGFYDLLAPAGLQSLLISLYLSLGVLMVFFFGVLYVVSIFYHSSDVEKILPLPLRADDIIGAKMLVTAFYEYLFLVALVAPGLIVYGVRSGAGLLYFLYLLAVIVILPVIPLCLSTILVMLIMRFTPLARNKDRFSMVSGMLALALALGVSFGSQSLSSFSEKDLSNLLGSGAGKIARITASIFPGTSQAAVALAEPAGWPAAGQIALLILIAAAVLFVTLRLSRLLYFKGVIGLTSSAASHRRLTSRELADTGASQPAFWAYVLKDVRVLVRTPIFFMNNVIINFLFPFFIALPLLAQNGSDEISTLIRMLRETAFDPQSGTASLALAIGFAAACFVSGTNGIAESALSREGKLLYLMKIWPMSYARQLWAKLTVGILFSLCGTLLVFLIFIILIQPPLWFDLLLLAVLPGATLLPNLAGIIFELFWPKLNWDNEQKAVKQNLNVVYGILLTMLVSALVIA
ncbi:MAG TPA: hypothetical protein DD640_04930, partial [Clostridiales bacterium]|nr:hypothetical protein [Clostridiales bacterium]